MNGFYSCEFIDINFRMADFAAFSLKVARADGREEMARSVLEKMESRRADMLLAEEPVAICLERWVVDPTNHGREVTAGDLNSEFAQIAKSNHLAWPYQSAKALGQRLSHIVTNLREQFDVEVSLDRHEKQKSYRFWPKGSCREQEDSAAVLVAAAQAGDAGAAGNAGYFEA